MGYRVWVSKSWWKVEVGSALQVHVKCPLLLSKKHPVTDAIFNYCHQAVVHGGRGQMLNQSEFWVIGGNSVCRMITHICLI